MQETQKVELSNSSTVQGDGHEEDIGASGGSDLMDMSLSFQKDVAPLKDQNQFDWIDEDVIPEDPMLAETHYSQYDDFEADDSEEDDNVGVACMSHDPCSCSYIHLRTMSMRLFWSALKMLWTSPEIKVRLKWKHPNI